MVHFSYFSSGVTVKGKEAILKAAPIFEKFLTPKEAASSVQKLHPFAKLWQHISGISMYLQDIYTREAKWFCLPSLLGCV